MPIARRRVSIAVLSCLLFLTAPLLASLKALRPAWLQISISGVPLAAWLTVALLALFVALTWFSLSVLGGNARSPADPP